MIKPNLSRLFRSEGQFEVLAVLVKSYDNEMLLANEEWLLVDEIAARAELDRSTAWRIVQDLLRSGVVEYGGPYADRREYRLNGTSPVFRELTALVEWEIARREAAEPRKQSLPPHNQSKLFVNRHVRADLIANIVENGTPRDVAEAWAAKHLEIYPR